MTTNVDTLVDTYLRELDQQLQGLPRTRRRELLAEVRDHISSARAELDAQTEARVRTVLERMGDPAEIAAEARERFGHAAGAPVPEGTPWLEVIALVLLLVPVVGWIPAVILIALSRHWSRREKLTAWLVPLAWLLPAFGVSSSETGGLPVVVVAMQLVLPFIIPVLTALYLAVRLRARYGSPAAV
jgi:4-amino-4-deoxy-L-arabinose transferase-like glycosyltransferase